MYSSRIGLRGAENPIVRKVEAKPAAKRSGNRNRISLGPIGPFFEFLEHGCVRPGSKLGSLTPNSFEKPARSTSNSQANSRRRHKRAVALSSVMVGEAIGSCRRRSAIRLFSLTGSRQANREEGDGPRIQRSMSHLTPKSLSHRGLFGKLRMSVGWLVVERSEPPKFTTWGRTSSDRQPPQIGDFRQSLRVPQLRVRQPVSKTAEDPL
jgi:hypothetical protein